MKLVNKILVVTAVASVMTACKPDLLDTNPYDKVGSGANKSGLQAVITEATAVTTNILFTNFIVFSLF